ncbi:putative integral membrane protein [Rosellinia necatrix]|uniref:Putative integral membrane protein n=1 Tax=Rosellinia necatrix TaxID=77044 RepID=A0A1W2TWW6_ROSNE|nr:putative integral membrane protein [Rosellinia necatrix]
MALTQDAISFIIIVVVTSVLSTIFTIARLVLRRRATLGSDDYVLMFVIVIVWAQLVAALLLNILGGVGKPFSTLTPSEVSWLLKLFYWPELAYTILVASVKMSILLSYKRIFGHNRTTLVHIYIMMGLVMSWGVAVFFTVVFQCSPVDKAWQPQKPGSCINLIAFLWGNSVSNFIIDWLILLVPVRPVLKLHMPKSQKLVVGGAFALGILACTASTVRAAVTGSVDVNDLSQSVFLASVWTYIEPNLAIVSACLPLLGKRIGRNILSGLDYAHSFKLKASTWFSFPADKSSNFPETDPSSQTSRGVTQRTDIVIDHTNRNRDPSYELHAYEVFAGSSTTKGHGESMHSLI